MNSRAFCPHGCCGGPPGSIWAENILRSKRAGIAYRRVESMSKRAADDFRRLIETHQRMVYSIALRMLGDAGAAEEVAQDVFLELYGAMDRLNDAEHVRAWLRRVSAWRAIDALRRRRTAGPVLVDEEWEDERYGTGEGNEGRCDGVSGRLEEMVLSLPVEYRAAIVLRYGEEMGPEEIAEALGQPVATVKSDLRRGLVMLRRKATVVLKEYVRE